MDRSMNMQSLPKWFTEGTAELIQGADERLAGAVAGGGGAAGVVSGAAAPDPSYGGAYAASRYLHDQLKKFGVDGGKDDLINLAFSAMNSSALGLSDLDMKKTAVALLLHIDQAIDFVDKQRVVVGAASNRLDMAASNTQTSSINLASSQSRIQDVDYASTTAKLTRSQILQQAASAMLTQANGQPSAVLALLR